MSAVPGKLRRSLALAIPGAHVGACLSRQVPANGGGTIFCNYIAKVSDRLIIMLPDYVQVPLGAGPVQDRPVSAVRNPDILPGHLHQELDNIEVALLCRERGFYC